MRMMVSLPPAAHDALGELATRERRDARDQATLLILKALVRRRLITGDGLERIPAHRPTT
jgi:hypothetical protein